MDAGAGIEPALTESKSVVLPLDDPAIFGAEWGNRTLCAIDTLRQINDLPHTLCYLGSLKLWYQR